MKKLVFLLFCMFSSLVFAFTDSEINEYIDRLTELTNSTAVEMAAPYIEEYSLGLANSLASMKPNFPSEATDILRGEISSYVNEQFFFNKEIKEMQYILYRKYFTIKDLEQLMEFYESELGNKIVQVAPRIASENKKNISIDLNSVSNAVAYRELLTEIEFAQFIKFNESELGKKISVVTPKLLVDSYQMSKTLITSIDKNLAEDIQPRINKRLSEYFKEKYNNTLNTDATDVAPIS